MDSEKLINSELDNLEKAIHFKKRYVLSLYKRLSMIRKDFALKSEYEKNEVEITELQTKSIIIKNVCNISQMEEVFRDQLDIYCCKLDKSDLV